jgi:hypothetical protein
LKRQRHAIKRKIAGQIKIRAKKPATENFRRRVGGEQTYEIISLSLQSLRRRPWHFLGRH